MTTLESQHLARPEAGEGGEVKKQLLTQCRSRRRSENRAERTGTGAPESTTASVVCASSTDMARICPFGACFGV